MLHAESEGVRGHHQISPSSAHQTSQTTSLAQKTPFAIQELLGLTNTSSEHEPMNTAVIKQQIQNGESNNPFSYYNHKASCS